MSEQWGKALYRTPENELFARRPDPSCKTSGGQTRTPTMGMCRSTLCSNPRPTMHMPSGVTPTSPPCLAKGVNLKTQVFYPLNNVQKGPGPFCTPQYATAQGRDPSPLKKEMRQWCLAPVAHSDAGKMPALQGRHRATARGRRCLAPVAHFYAGKMPALQGRHRATAGGRGLTPLARQAEVNLY